MEFIYYLKISNHKNRNFSCKWIFRFFRFVAHFRLLLLSTKCFSNFLKKRKIKTVLNSFRQPSIFRSTITSSNSPFIGNNLQIQI